MISVGLDLGKRKSQLCALDAGGLVVRERRLDTTREDLLVALAGLGPARVLLEASTSSGWVARLLTENGFEAIVADPRFTPMYAHANRKVKTDRRDALALATALHVGAFRPTHCKSEYARELRAKVMIRSSLLGTRTRLISEARALCEQEGIAIKSCDGERFVSALAGKVSGWLADAIAPLVEEISGLDERIKALDADLHTRAKEDPVTKNLMTIRGVGPLTSLAFRAAIDDPSRFKSARELASYLGLVPSERSSGDVRRRPGAITKTGDPLVRAYLTEAAFNIMQQRSPDTALKRWAHGVVIRHQSKLKAAVGLARRLARIMFAMWRDNVPFKDDRTHPDVRAA